MKLKKQVTYHHVGVLESLNVRAMVSVVAEDAYKGPDGGEVGDGEAADDPLLSREVDLVRRGSEPPVDGPGNHAREEPLRPRLRRASPLRVLLNHHRPEQNRDKFA